LFDNPRRRIGRARERRVSEALERLLVRNHVIEQLLVGPVDKLAKSSVFRECGRSDWAERLEASHDSFVASSAVRWARVRL
jgi:hypothetical protein